LAPSAPISNDAQVGPLDLLVVIADNARLLAFIPIFTAAIAIVVAFLMPATYSARTRILPPQQQQNPAAVLGALSGIATAAGFSIRNQADTYVALIKSRTVADRIVERFSLMSVYGAVLREDARKQLSNATTVALSKDGLITIDVEAQSSRLAADLANAYVEEVSVLSGRLAITEAQQRRVFFEQQLKHVQHELKKAEVALSETGASESVLKAAPQAVVETLARLKAQVTAQEIKISTMRQFLTGASPEYQLAQRELFSLRAQLSQVERNQPGTGEKRAEYLNKFRDFKYQETLLELLAKQYELARLDEAREGALIQVVDPGLPPERSSKRHPAVVGLVAGFGAALLTVLFVFARESIRRARLNVESFDKLSRVRAGMRRLLFR
jgi:tyrosine-protein kinase Etk/Wzc